MSVRWEHEIRNKCVHGVVLSKKANERKSDCNARILVEDRTLKKKKSPRRTMSSSIWILKKK